LREVVHVGERVPAGTTGFADLVRGRFDAPTYRPDPDDVYVIGYTSGTTGTPKGAMLTHRTVRNGSRMNAISHRMPLAGVCAFTGSLSLAAPACGIVVPHLLLGGTTVLLGDWDAELLVDTIERERTTHVFLPSPVIQDFTALATERLAAVRSLASVLHSGSLA
jgi:fatty-acyl-CoA synthase